MARGDGWDPRDVVPEVGVGVAAPDVEHRCGDDDPRVPAVGAEERPHPGVVAGAVLDDDLGLGQRGGVGGARLEEVRVGVGVGDQRGHPDVAPPSWLAMLPQKFSAATTWTTGDGAGAGDADDAGEPEEGETEGARQQRERPKESITITVIILNRACKALPGVVPVSDAWATRARDVSRNYNDP